MSIASHSSSDEGCGLREPVAEASGPGWRRAQASAISCCSESPGRSSEGDGGFALGGAASEEGDEGFALGRAEDAADAWGPSEASSRCFARGAGLSEQSQLESPSSHRHWLPTRSTQRSGSLLRSDLSYNERAKLAPSIEHGGWWHRSPCRSGICKIATCMERKPKPMGVTRLAGRAGLRKRRREKGGKRDLQCCARCRPAPRPNRKCRSSGVTDNQGNAQPAPRSVTERPASWPRRSSPSSWTQPQRKALSSSHCGTWVPSGSFSACSDSAPTMPDSPGSRSPTKEVATPLLPMRPVRPMRCT